MTDRHDAEGQPLSLGQELDVRVARSPGRLSANDERVLAFVREHQDALAFHTAESLAQGAGVSAAAVVRFARRLGFASFRELRDRARDELRPAPPEAIEPAPATGSMLLRKAQRDAESLRMLPPLLEQPLAQAAALLAGARTVWVLANRETFGLAVYVQRLMHHVRDDVRLVDPSFADPLRGLGEEDVLLACSFRPYARQTLQLMTHARRAGTPLVLVTDGGGRTALDTADIVLAVPVESPTPLLSFTPAVCVLETLVGQVAMLDADRTHGTLEATGRWITEQELVVERRRRPPRGTEPPAGPRRRR